MSPKMKIDFYRVSLPPEANVSFHQILQRAAQLPQDASRNIQFRGVPVRLQEASDGGGIFHGDMIRIRLDKFPLKVSLAGYLEVIDLEPDEGMGEETAFSYHAPLNILLVQRNHFGVSVPAIAYYFQQAGHLTGPIRLDPIMNEAVYARFDRLQTIRKFDIRLAGIDNFDLLRDQDFAGLALADLMQRLRAPNISVTLSMGRSRGALISQAVKELARNFMTFANEMGHVNKIELVGRDAEFNEPLVIDLINDRMIESIPVTVDEQRRLPYPERRRALDVAWQHRQAELAHLFLPPEG